MGLRVRFMGGPRDGETVEFEDGVEQITFGRDPGLCQVLFPPHERAVGREHCALKRVLGRYRIVLNGENAVLVDRRDAFEYQELPDEADLQLGPTGPTVHLSRLGSRIIPPTMVPGMGRRAPRLAQQQIEEEVRAARTSRRIAIGASVVALLAVVAAVWAFTNTGREVERLRQGVEKNLTGALEKFGKVEERVARLEPRMRAALKKAAPSVYLVLTKDAAGEEESQATAWVVAPGLVATNAHVAMIFKELAEGASLWIRSNEPTPKTFRIAEVTIHPGRDLFEEVWTDYEPAYGNSLKTLRPVRAAGYGFDVAVMKVEAPEGLAPPLAVASDEAIQGVAAGSAVGFVGYPLENVALESLKRPSPTTQIGIVTAVTDYFGASLSDEERKTQGHLVLHNLPAAGGASGSPILDEEGHVVAVLSGGNVVFAEGKRISTGVGVNFAQRADLVRELIEDRAQGLQQERRRHWEATLKEMFTSGFVLRRDESVKGMLRRTADERDVAGGMRFHHEWKEAHGEIVAAPGSVEMEVAGVGPWLLLAAAAHQQPLSLVVEATLADGSTRALEDAADEPWLHHVVVPEDAAGTLRIRVESEKPDASCHVTLYGAERSPITAEDLIGRITSSWLQDVGREESAEFEAREVLSESASLESPDPGETVARFRRDLTLPEAGLYLVVAVAPGGEDIDLEILQEKDGTLESLASDRENDHFPVVRLKAEGEATVTVRVVGQASGTSFQLRAYRAAAK